VQRNPFLTPKSATAKQIRSIDDSDRWWGNEKGKEKKEWKQNQEGDEFAASDENRMQGVVEKEVKRYCESEIKSKRRINSVCGESKVVVAKVEQSQR
jgi:hypothetical protein